MATRYDLTYTRDDICTHALSMVGRIYEGQTPSSTLLDSSAEHLNLLIKELQNEHAAPWSFIDEEITLVADAETYTYATPGAGPGQTNKIIFLVDAYVSKTASSDEYYPIEIQDSLKIRERFYDSNHSSIPTCVSLTSSTALTFYPKPDVAYKVRFRALAEDAEFDAGSDSLGAPARWFMFFKYALAAELAADYRLPRTEIQDFRNEALRLFRRGRKGDHVPTPNRRIRPAYLNRTRRWR